MDISAKEDNGLTILSVSGRLDASNAKDFDTGCEPYLHESNRIVLDLTGLDYLSSAGLRSILLLAKQLKGLNGGLALAGLKGIVKEVFTLTRCDTIMPVFEKVEDAARGEWLTGSTSKEHG